MEIKERILQSATALFMRNGIKSVSMDDIASHLAMSKKTLYKWFENKDQIVHGVLASRLQESQVDCGKLQNQADTAIDELFGMMDWMKQQFAEVHPSIFYDLQKFHPAAWRLWMDHKHQFILNQIIDNLHRGIEEGLYRSDLDVEVLARLRLAQIELAFNNEVFSPREFDAKRIQVIVLEHFMLGVATLKGHKLINKHRHVTEEE